MSAGESFDFDTVRERRGTDSEKWARWAGRDVLPLWVADMDFATPPPVVAALRARVDHGIFGYAMPDASHARAVTGALARDCGWQVDPEWLVWLPGLVSGLTVACRAVGQPGDGVLVMPPVYGPFLRVPGHVGREPRRAPLAGDNRGGWRFDFGALDAAADERTRLLLLCHPHNPVGRAWRRDELEELAAFAARRDLVVCSDEIHSELLLEPGRPHVPFATLSADAAARTITLLAPSKTYNVPGLGCAVAVISEPSLRRRFQQAMAGIVPHVNALGLLAARAAWTEGAPWRAALLDYLRGNRDYLAARVASCPGVTMAPVEATYLAWFDARDWGLDDPHAHALAHGLGLSDGRDFGAPGWLRLNFGCPRTTLAAACDRLAAAASAAVEHRA
jgi:cysteine-S-conjugate beta-lyase